MGRLGPGGSLATQRGRARCGRYRPGPSSDRAAASPGYPRMRKGTFSPAAPHNTRATANTGLILAMRLKIWHCRERKMHGPT